MTWLPWCVDVSFFKRGERILEYIQVVKTEGTVFLGEGEGEGESLREREMEYDSGSVITI